MGTPAQYLQVERLKYPGMLPREILIWRNWLKLHETEFERFDYNVRVGQGTDPGASYPEPERSMAIQISQKRIDVVAWKGGRVTLVEVEDRPGVSGPAQLAAYETLWRADNPTEGAPVMLLVVPRIQPDTLTVAVRAGIRVEIVETSFDELRPKK